MLYSLITGACGYLGGAFAFELAARGEPLYLTGRSEERLLARAAQIRERFPAACVRCFPCDLADGASRKAFFAHCEGEGVRFCRLVYAAGADIQKAFSRYTEEKLAFQARVNFEGAVSFARFFLSRAELDGTAELLAVGSVSSLVPMPYFALYSATKKALEQFFSALRTELTGKAKVCCVRPGAIPTRDDVKEYIRAQGLWGRLAALPPETVAKRALAAVRKNKRAPVIGLWNKLMHAATALLPLSLKMRFIAARWSKTQKDAF